MRRDLLPAGFVPEGQFDPVPEAELVVDNSEVVFDNVLRGPDGVRDFAVLKSLGNELDDSLFTLAGDPISITLFSEHNCLR
jgi:hypothetical protein